MASLSLSLRRVASPVWPARLYRLLKRCMLERDLVAGRNVDALCVRVGLASDPFFAHHIIRMYAAHGCLHEARQVFRRVATPDHFVWASIIAAHGELREPHQAIRLYQEMRELGVQANDYVFVAVLKACASAGDLVSGRLVHADVAGTLFEANAFVGSTLVDMYAKCGSLEDARAVFEKVKSKNVVTWSAMIAGYAQEGLGREALDLYKLMQQDGRAPANSFTFVSILKACGSIGAVQEGRGIHEQILDRGLECDVRIGSALVDMYVKCGSLGDALAVFDQLPVRNVVTWSAMISGYAQHGLGQEALALYDRMQEQRGLVPDSVTFVSVLNACTSIGALKKGRKIHAEILDRGLEAEKFVQVGLLEMYAKCGSLNDAWTVFNRLPGKNAVTWNALIAGCVQHGLGHEALQLYDSMKLDVTTSPTTVTYVCVLKACGSIGALQAGMRMHAEILEKGLEGNLFLGNTLVDMYGRCCRMEDACSVFETLPTRDVGTWTALINGFGQCHEFDVAVQCFELMQLDGVEANAATFTCLLVGCSHGGLVSQGQYYFKIMVEEYGIAPTIEHYNCMVDLLGRAGHLDEAEAMLRSMPFRWQENIVGWKTLLTACKQYGDVERARICFDRLLQLEPQHAAGYVLMASISARCGNWDEVEKIEEMRKAAGAHRKPAKTWIQVDHSVQEFIVGGERDDIVSKLRSMNLLLKEQGHVPHTELVLKLVSEQEKEDALCGHAEKLALAFGLLNTPAGTPLLITKNLRMCNDCHSGTKLLSRIEKREIVVRDAHCVHRFANGTCSCGDSHLTVEIGKQSETSFGPCRTTSTAPIWKTSVHSRRSRTR